MDIEEVLDKIKTYADIAVDQAGRLSKAAATKTENAVSKAKIKYVISETEGKIYDIYAEIGEKVYQKFLEGILSDSDLTGECEKISELNEELDALNAQLADLRDIVKCNYCGAYNNTENVFCAKCGAKIFKDSEGSSEDSEEAYEAADTVEVSESND